MSAQRVLVVLLALTVAALQSAGCAGPTSTPTAAPQTPRNAQAPPATVFPRSIPVVI